MGAHFAVPPEAQHVFAGLQVLGDGEVVVGGHLREPLARAQPLAQLLRRVQALRVVAGRVEPSLAAVPFTRACTPGFLLAVVLDRNAEGPKGGGAEQVARVQPSDQRSVLEYYCMGHGRGVHNANVTHQLSPHGLDLPGVHRLQQEASVGVEETRTRRRRATRAKGSKDRVMVEKRMSNGFLNGFLFTKNIFLKDARRTQATMSSRKVLGSRKVTIDVVSDTI